MIGPLCALLFVVANRQVSSYISQSYFRHSRLVANPSEDFQKDCKSFDRNIERCATESSDDDNSKTKEETDEDLLRKIEFMVKGAMKVEGADSLDDKIADPEFAERILGGNDAKELGACWRVL